jgi:hypothetical protein
MSVHKIYNTPLLKKIGAKENQHIIVIDAPEFIIRQLNDASIRFNLVQDKKIRYDLVWAFINNVPRLESCLRRYKTNIAANGMIWISWYKKASGQPSELNENIIRDTALSLDLVDVKVVSVDDQWSALKMVIPLNKR